MLAEQRRTLQQLFANGLRRTLSCLLSLPLARRPVPAMSTSLLRDRLSRTSPYAYHRWLAPGPRTKIIAPSVRRDGNARNVVLTCMDRNPSRIIFAGMLIATPVHNTWTLNPINVSFKFGRWTTTTPCNRPSTCSLTSRQKTSRGRTRIQPPGLPTR